MASIEIVIDLGKYKYIDLPLDKAIEFVDKAIEIYGETLDLSETSRYVKNFDEFYGYMRRKFKDFIAPPKSSREVVLGKTFIHKVKLYVHGSNEKRVLLVVDRRVPLDILKKILNDIGYDNVKVEKSLF
ncbi:MAG: hypothetical protein DRO40_02280 [Thermoprotei archaeon]|nr:MAG: hypothetical protein DRO40_02280 [Thermoprotei archaeon]